MVVNLNKANSSNEKRRLYRRDYYENTHLDVSAGAVRVDWLRGRTGGCEHNNYDDHARSDNGRSGRAGGHA